MLNKADMKTKNDLETIATNIREVLEDKSVEICGIGAYSSKNYEKCKGINENSSIFTPLEGFLRSLDKKSEKQNEILSVLYEVHLAYERAIEQDADKFKRYQKALHSLELDLMQKGFDDFSDASFNKIESLKKEFSEQERSKRENLEKLNQVINLFKKSIDKVFDRMSAFTWEKYKEENDDENDDEENYREFEEIKEMVLYIRDCTLCCLDCYDLNKKQIKEARERIDSCNELLQLDYSLANLMRLREFKEKEEENEDYQKSLNDEEFQNDLREWRDLRSTPEETNRREFEEIKKMVLHFRDCWMFVVEQLDGKSSQEEFQKYKGFVSYNNKLLQLDYSLENLLTLREYRATHEEVYQADLNNSGLQKDLQEWKSKTTPIGKNVIKFREIKAMILGCRGFYRRHMEDRRAELNPKAFNRCKEQVDECNDLLRLDYSSKNLKQLKQFKNDVYNKTYQEDLQKKWRRSKG